MKTRIKNWVLKDGIVKRGNKISVERAIDLTFEKTLDMLKLRMAEGHGYFENSLCISKEDWKNIADEVKE